MSTPYDRHHSNQRRNLDSSLADPVISADQLADASSAVVLIPHLGPPRCLHCVTANLAQRRVPVVLVDDHGCTPVEPSQADDLPFLPPEDTVPARSCLRCLLSATGLLVKSRQQMLSIETLPLDRLSLQRHPGLSRLGRRPFPSSLRPADPRFRILALIPAYNEERFIGSVVLRARLYAHQVIVVDDGSTDGTARLARAAGAQVLRHFQNQGKGAALNTGFQHARDLDADIVVTLDADGQHSPQEFARFVSPIQRGVADVVIGSRYLGDHSQVPRLRILGHKIFNFLSRQASGTSSTDSQSGYRAFSRRAIECLSFTSSGFSVESEMQFIVKMHHLELVEVPVTIQYTDSPKRSVYRQGMLVLAGILRLVGQYRPLLFFSLPGLAMITCAASVAIWIVKIFYETQQLAVGYALISVMLFVIGTIAISTGIILHTIRGLLADWLLKREDEIGPEGAKQEIEEAESR